MKRGIKVHLRRVPHQFEEGNTISEDVVSTAALVPQSSGARTVSRSYQVAAEMDKQLQLKHFRRWRLNVLALNVLALIAIGCAMYGWSMRRVQEMFTTDFNVKSGTVLGCCYQGWAGMAFTMGPVPVKVVQLGRWTMSGNRGTHVMKLVNATTKLDVPGTAANLSLAGCPPDQFCFVALPHSVTLAPNVRYYLLSSEKALNADDDRFYAHDALVTASGIAILRRPVYWTGKSWTELDTPGASYGPVTFTYTP